MGLGVRKDHRGSYGITRTKELSQEKKLADLVVPIRSGNTSNNLRLPHMYMYFLKQGQAMTTEYLLLQVKCEGGKTPTMTID